MNLFFGIVQLSIKEYYQNMERKHLKPYLYYSDQYDRYTVEKCRRLEKPSDTELPKDKKVTKKQMAAIAKAAKDIMVYAETGERYLNKESTIRKWMDKDQKLDDLYESAQAPEDIRCLTCRNRVVPTFKQLWTEHDKEDRMLFVYDCPNKCLPRRAFFSNGEEWRTKPNLCPNCTIPLSQKADDNGVRLVTTYSCKKCNYSKTDELVWSKKKEENIDENFATDRDRFCLTEEAGNKYRDSKYNLERLGKLLKELDEKDKARQEKLKENTKGFHVEGVGYTCPICGGSTPKGDNWYDQWGIKCLVCQKAIDKGEIPGSLAKNKDSWYTKWEFDHYFKIKGPTLQKWVRNGTVKARTVSVYGQGVHCQLFLIKDNKDFLPPKELVKSHSVHEVKDSKDCYTSHPWYHFKGAEVSLKGYKIMDYIRIVKEEKESDKQVSL